MGNIHGCMFLHNSKSVKNVTYVAKNNQLISKIKVPNKFSNADLDESIAIVKLFEKIELTADAGNAHPGELSQEAFDKVFHGPLHMFGKLMFRRMITHPRSERVTRDEFVSCGKKILSMKKVSDQQEFYIGLFLAGQDFFTKHGFLQMARMCYAFSSSVNGLEKFSEEEDDDALLFNGMLISLFGVECAVSREVMRKWVATNCGHIFDNVHYWVCSVLHEASLPVELRSDTPRLAKVGDVKGLQHCLSPAVLWVLSTVLPIQYRLPEKIVKQKWTVFSAPTWHLLYHSEQDGLSGNRFAHNVMSYCGSSLTFFHFEGGNLYCLASDVRIRDGAEKHGGDDCRLLQLLPVYRVVQSGRNMIMYNGSSRSVAKGLYIGQDGKGLVLRLGDSFETVHHYAVPCRLQRIETWGCAGDAVLRMQTEQKQNRNCDIEQSRTRALQMAGSWDDNPDKHLLSWMGINAFETNLSLAFRQTDDVYPIPPHRGDVSCLL